MASSRPTGARHPRWNDGKILSSHGYVKLRVGKDHPLADSKAFCYEHLVVWAAAGRPLPGPDEILHHKNENREDNRLSNLVCMSRAEHARLHAIERMRGRDGRFAPRAA